MKIAIAGASGFIGTHLTDYFQRNGWQVVSLDRSDLSAAGVAGLTLKLSDCEVVINLAGASISKRWTKKHKQLIYDSRIDTTRRLVSAINSLSRKPELLISASAVGIYPGDRIYTEADRVVAPGFLAKVCRDWEKAASQVDRSVRLAITRFGVVLSADGGAFPLMSLPIRKGLAVRIGNGRQYFSWIHLLDLERGMKYLIENAGIEGIINMTAPQVSTNAHFTKTAAGLLHRPMISLPKHFFRAALGEGYGIVAQGQGVRPEKLLQQGFVFDFPDIETALPELFASIRHRKNKRSDKK